MKKVFLGLALVASIVACKKDDKNDSGSKTTREKIVGIWLGDKQIDVEKTNGTVTYSDTTDLTGFQLNFANDGNVFFSIGGFPLDTASWALNGDTRILLDGEEFTIKNLTDNQFHVGYDSTYVGGGTTMEYMMDIYLKR